MAYAIEHQSTVSNQSQSGVWPQSLVVRSQRGEMDSMTKYREDHSKIRVILLMVLCTLFVFCVNIASAQISISSGDGILNPLTFSGSDLGAQINNAIASSAGVYKKIVIPGTGSPYTWSTTVTIDPRYVSIVGQGSGITFIDCTASPCLSLYEANFSLDPGGVIGGFTMTGNGSASQVGIQSAGVFNERWDDITFSGFTGTGAVSWYLYNSNSSNGWQERIHASKIRIENGSGLKFSYNAANIAASSFGYSDFDVSCDTEGANQTCFQVASGRLYGSDIHIQGNIYQTGTLLEALTGPNPGDMDDNRYLIQAEPLTSATPGTCIHAGVNAKIEGLGTVICNGSALTDDNGITYTQHLRIVPSDTDKAANVIGFFPNFNGTGNAATAYVEGVFGLSNPYAQFGMIHGPYIDSTYSASQTQPGNGHFFYSCPASYSGGLSGCTVVAQVLNTGVINASSGFSSGGLVGYTGTKTIGACAITFTGGIVTAITGC